MRSTIRFIALLATCASAFATPLPIPPSLWGNGTGSVQLDAVGYIGPKYRCDYDAYTGNCSTSIVTNQPSAEVGEADGQAWSKIDAAGAHLFGQVDVAGHAAGAALPIVWFSDTVSNSKDVPYQFDLQFHIDADLYGINAGRSGLDIEFWNPYMVWDWSGGGTAAGLHFPVNRDITIPNITVYPHSSTTWFLKIAASAGVSGFHDPNLPLSQAIVDVANTLYFTGMPVFDQNGNPVGPGFLDSQVGFQYGGASIATTPEPSTGWLALAAAAFLFFRRKN